MTAFDRAWAIMKSMGQCDGCGEEDVVGQLPLGGSSVINLCRPCWAAEMDWRQISNEELMYRMQPDVKPEIPDELNDHGAIADFIEGLASFIKPTEESLFPILPFPHMEEDE